MSTLPQLQVVSLLMLRLLSNTQELNLRLIEPFSVVIFQNHKFTYGEPISVKSLTRSICDLALHFGEGDPTAKKKPMVCIVFCRYITL